MGKKVSSAEETINTIRRTTRRQYSSEEKIRIVLEGLRGEESITGLGNPWRGTARNLYTGSLRNQYFLIFDYPRLQEQAGHP
jgi:hypothetical protein